MQQQALENVVPQVKKAIRKKRSKYVKMPKEAKRELIFRVLMLNEDIKTACEELSFNFSTGRNLLQKYKRTGDYGYSDEFPAFLPQHTPGASDSVTGTDSKAPKCPLGLVLFSEDNIRLVPGKEYSPEEEQHILRLHTGLSQYLASPSRKVYS